jgi:hypothetical protein
VSRPPPRPEEADPVGLGGNGDRAPEERKGELIRDATPVRSNEGDGIHDELINAVLLYAICTDDTRTHLQESLRNAEDVRGPSEWEEPSSRRSRGMNGDVAAEDVEENLSDDIGVLDWVGLKRMLGDVEGKKKSFALSVNSCLLGFSRVLVSIMYLLN